MNRPRPPYFFFFIVFVVFFILPMLIRFLGPIFIVLFIGGVIYIVVQNFKMIMKTRSMIDDLEGQSNTKTYQSGKKSKDYIDVKSEEVK